MKKAISFILSVCMCITCLTAVPLCASAENSEAPQTIEEYILDMSGIKTSYLDTDGTGSVWTTVNKKQEVVDENGDTVTSTVKENVVGVFVNKKITTTAGTTLVDGEEIQVDESVAYEKGEFLTDLTGFTFKVENEDVISAVDSEGNFTIKKSGVTRLTATYTKDDKTATASCFITVAENGRLHNSMNQDSKVEDPYYGETRDVTVVKNNNTYNAANSYGTILGDSYQANGKTFYRITMPKTYVISEWDYDEGTGNTFSSALISELTNINLKVYAAKESEYYMTRSFIENSRDLNADGNKRYTETNVKRTKGWHQITAVMEPGTVKDDINSAKVTLYIDGQQLLSYENVLDSAVQTGTYKLQEMKSGSYATGFCIARCEASAASVKAVYPNDNATNVPVDSEIGVAFNGKVGEGYAEKIKVENSDGVAVPFNASLNTNGNKVKIDTGRLDEETVYTVTVTDMPIVYTELTYEKKGTAYTQTATSEIGTVSTKYSFTTKKTDAGSYLETTLKNMRQQKHSMDYMRYADFSKSSSNMAEVGEILNNEHIKLVYPRDNTTNIEVKDGITTKIADNMLSVDFAADAKKGGSVSFYDLDSFKDYNCSDVVVASYKYRIRGENSTVNKSYISNPIGTISHIAQNREYKTQNEISGKDLVETQWDGVFMGQLKKDYGNSYGNNRTPIITTANLKNQKWVELTYIIEYNDGVKGTSARKIKKITAHGPNGTFEWDSVKANSELISYNLRRIVQSMSANTEEAIGFDFKDFEVYGFTRPVESNLALNVTKNGTAVDPANASGVVDIAFDATMGEDITADVIIAIKEQETNKLVGCILNSETAFKAGEPKSVSEKFDLSETPGAYSFEAYVWDSVKGLVPQYPITVYTYTAPAETVE